METDYSPSPSGGNQDNQWKIFALGGIISWFILIVTGFLTFWEPDIRISWNYKAYHRGILFWLYPTFITTDGIPYALYMFYLIFFPIIIICLLIFCLGLVIYIYCLFIKGDYNVINAMFGKYTKFHFVPFLCASVCFIISECTEEKRSFTKVSKFQTFLIIIFSFAGLISMSFIYFLTKLEYPIYARLTINRGTYSCLVALFSFGFFYNIFYLGFLDREKEDYNYSQKEWKDLKDWIKGCNYAFSIIFGGVNLGLSVFFKDIVLSGINCLMYIGMAINFFLIEDKVTENYFDDKLIVGFIDIIMALASAGLAAALFIIFKPYIQNNNE